MNLPIITPDVTKPYNILSSASRLKSFPVAEVIPKDFGKFIYTIAHEIGNPLTNISIAIEALKQVVRDNEEMYLDIIKRNSARINAMLSDLLTSSNINE